MADDKRFLRELRRAVKRKGNRKRRRYLKDIAANPEDFTFGRARCDNLDTKTIRSKPKEEERPTVQPLSAENHSQLPLEAGLLPAAGN